jgi:hypothetical protein
MKIHANVLGMGQQRLLSRLGPLLNAWGYYLAGGTALALHLGHRRSLDLDWFTSRSVGDPLRLAQRLREEKLPFRTKQTARGTLHGMIAGVRVSLLEYRYRLLRPLLDAPRFGCVLASLEDLAAMKSRRQFGNGYLRCRGNLHLAGYPSCPAVRNHARKTSAQACKT